MMDRLVYLIVVLLSCSACCDSSQGCCGDPPNPELTPEAKSWLVPYQQKEFFVFENQAGNQDTLAIQFETDTEYCGGDECGSNCKIERAVLQSLTDTAVHLTIEARYNDKIVVNEPRVSADDYTLLLAEVSLSRDIVSTSPTNAEAELISDYTFNGAATIALTIACVEQCTDFRMPSMVISQEKGLIEFDDYLGNEWVQMD